MTMFRRNDKLIENDMMRRSVMDLKRKYFWFSFVVAVLVFSVVALGQGERVQFKALIVDGQNNHDWVSTTPVLRDILEVTGLFRVEVATSPGARASMEGFAPKFSDFDVVVLNYNGADWSKETQAAFEAYVGSGGGVVVYHAADNAFAGWTAFNEMIGVGGWGGRDEKSGPYVRFRDGKMVLDTKPGRGGSHGPQHEFQVVMRDREHPITKGLPEKWLHVKDELYSELRGPAKNLTLLATAYADPAKGGTGENEPALFTITWGEGRIFHTTLGHDGVSSKCVGFVCTLQRGTEWAATGMVTLTDVPKDFPTADQVSMRRQIKVGMDIANYDFGDSRKDLVAIEDEVRGASEGRLREIEAGLLKVLETPGATYASKQFACRLLRRIGTEPSKELMGRLLLDEEMSHLARFVLEGMENDAAGAVLRRAMGELVGDLLIGVIGSLGARSDRQAVEGLAILAESNDDVLVEAVIKALGRIG
ncbi:MAG: ThuA domain-containing protein, partial [Planctomycetes bacterium]|nr:ThuA domain-containing protein [Planctomycetota bacterium]